jgi:hypothetical protein
MTKKIILLTSLLILISISILSLPFPQSIEIGTGDFRPYWSASYLLANHQDFSDISNMAYVERTYTGWTEPITMMAWFAPTGNFVLLPYTLFPFNRAAFLWLISNILVVSISIFLLWNKVKIYLWIPFIVVFGFSMTLLSLYVGQINTLVLLGLAIFISLDKNKYDYLKGASLVLITIKPHLVILTLPLIVLNCLRNKQWRILLGFFCTLTVMVLILYFLYPKWPISFWKLITSGMGSLRNAPTISGLLLIVFGQMWGKWLWLPLLIFTIIYWFFRGKKWDFRTMVDISLILGLFISPLGWSYDQIILLIPVISILGWMVKGSLPKVYTIILSIIFLLSNGISYVMRIMVINDVWFFWIPLMVQIVYIIGKTKSNNMVLINLKKINQLNVFS